jgi:hypothetical protein
MAPKAPPSKAGQRQPTMMRPASTPEEFFRALAMPLKPREPDPMPSFDLWGLGVETLRSLIADLSRSQPDLSKVVADHLKRRETTTLVNF